MRVTSQIKKLIFKVEIKVCLARCVVFSFFHLQQRENFQRHVIFTRSKVVFQDHLMKKKKFTGSKTRTRINGDNFFREYSFFFSFRFTTI